MRPHTSLGKNCLSGYAFSGIFKLEASPAEGQLLLQKDMKSRKPKQTET